MRWPFVAGAHVAVYRSPVGYCFTSAVVFRPVAGAFGWCGAPLFGVTLGSVGCAESASRFGCSSAGWVGADALGTCHLFSPAPTCWLKVLVEILCKLSDSCAIRLEPRLLEVLF